MHPASIVISRNKARQVHIATTDLPLLQNFPVYGPRLLRGAPPLEILRSRIPAHSLDRLSALCEATDTGLFCGLHVLLALLLGRCSGERHVTLATPAPGLVAHLGISLADADNVPALLLRSREQARAARVDTALALGARASFELNFAQRDGRGLDADTGVSGDFAVRATRDAQGIAIDWIHAADLLGATMAQRIVRRFDRLVESALADPGRDPWRLDWLDDEERHLVVEVWNATEEPYCEDTIHALFEQQALRTPDAIAIVHRGIGLTYRELDDRANRLAHHLRAQGVRAQCPVPICMRRSPDLVVGLLAIMKAGGAYVPVDPQYPRDRIDFMVADSGAPWVLTQSDTLEKLNPEVGRVVIDAPETVAALQVARADNLPPPDSGAAALAYVIYTSGSTGRPKGVCIEHRQAAAMIGWARNVYDDDALSGMLAATSICFDLSVFELFVPLSFGGRVLLVDHPLDIEGIRGADGVRLVNTVPSAVKALVEEGAIPDSVRIVNLAGEPLPESLVKDIYAKTSAKAVYNLYGPSEDTTYSTVALIPRDEDRAPSIGRAISNGKIYVLDAHLDPVPVGVVGEVYVAGDGVTRGYWQRPDLTAERFIANPFARIAGERMYKTGDLARWTERGDLDFLGRADFQVKLRGLRIELGEIQARLLDLDVLDDAVVTVYEDARGEKQLVAYVVPVDQAIAHVELSRACRGCLAESLPDYMIPQVFVPLRALPQTPNGKIDRAALPAPPESDAAEFVAPETEAQAALARMWQDVLRQPTAISMRANFFDLGGNSLAAMRLLSRVRQEFDMVVPPAALFSCVSLEDFCRVVERGGERAPPPLARVEDREALPLSFAQEAIWLTDQIDGGSLQYNVQQRYLLDGELDVEALRLAFDALVRRHESLRTLIDGGSEQPAQKIVDAPLVPFRLLDLSGMPRAEQADEVARIVRDDAVEPFALDADSMLRVALMRFDATRHELLLTVHHIATDGWSIDLTATELGALYARALSVDAPPLPPLPIQYADYAVWQRNWLTDSLLDEQARHWEHKLAHAPAVHRLPLDRARCRQQDRSAGTLRTRIHPAATRALQELCREERATLFMGVHAVFAILIARHANDGDVVLGMPVANRELPELASLIGLFTNTVALRTQVSERTDFMGVLRQCRNEMVDAHAHQRVPFSEIVKRLKPERTLDYTPIYQIMLSLQDTGLTPLALPGIAATTLRPRIERALVELMLEVTETSDGLVLDWIYRRELFDASTIEHLARHFDNLLRAAVVEPRTPIGLLSMLDNTDLQRIALVAPAMPSTGFVAMHEAFQALAARAPDAPALRSGDASLSRAALERCANQCAHRLRAQGAGPESVVAICGERSPETAIAVLATLKAGGVCLPLDAGRPHARNLQSARDAGARTAIVPLSQASAWLADGIDVVVIDDAAALAACPDTPPAPVSQDPDGEGRAWLLPATDDASRSAAVALSHRTLAGFCRWHAEASGLDDSARCSWLAAIDVDLSALELCSALLSGASLVAVDDRLRTDAQALGDLIRRERITHCIVDDAHMVDGGFNDAFGSDALRVLVRRTHDPDDRRMPSAAAARRMLWHAVPGMPIAATWREVDAADDAEAVVSERGAARPIAAAGPSVRNALGALQPIGVVGDLYVAAPCAQAEGSDDQAATPERSLSGSVRTGLVARWRGDGLIEYLGRSEDWSRPVLANAGLVGDANADTDPHDAVAAASMTATEATLHVLWARLLKRDRVDPGLNFFSAGGNSLLLLRMMHGVRESFGVNLPIKVVYEHLNIRQLALAIDGFVDAVPVPSTLPESSRSRFSLSLSQFRIWYREQIRGTNEHNVPFAVHLRGTVHVALVEEALNRLVARHALLRAGFVLDDEAPVQVVATQATLPFEFHDLSGLNPSSIEAKLQTLTVGLTTRRFDIRQPPLAAAMLLRTAADEYTLQLNFHHLVFDGSSFSIFLDEWVAIYDALAEGKTPQLPALTHGYAEFVAWQNAWLDSDDARAQAAFWQTYLHACPEHLTLARPGGWPASTDDAPSHIGATIDADVRAKLLDVAGSSEGSLFSLLYTAFALVLGRLAGQDDLSIGIPVSGRHQGAAHGVIGNFLNNLPLRTRWNPAQPFVDLLSEQIANLESAFSHQDYPFEKMLEQAPHLRSTETTPIFQVFFNMPNVEGKLRSRHLGLELQASPAIDPKFDLTMYVVDAGTSISMVCHYKRHLLPPAYVSHLLRQYVHLLEQISVDPTRACAAYSLRPEALDVGGRTPEPERYWSGAVHEIFHERAQATPQATAIVEHGQTWTYDEVLRASLGLAGALQEQGVGRGDVVAIVAARRASLVVAMLAALHTGAAFSLLNPEYPVERVALLVDIVKPACVLFAGEAALFPAALNARLEGLTACRHLPAAKAAQLSPRDDFRPAEVDAQDLACVTFTSGTTGVPKAVAGTHIGIAGYLGWVPQWLQLSRGDRFSLLSGLGHDPLQRDVFTSLCLGATLAIPDTEDIAPHALARWLRAQAITFAHMTPAMADILCTTDATAFPSLRIAFLTGERLSDDTVQKLLGFNRQMRVLNSYGTTETQRATTYYEASAARPGRGMVPASEASPDTVIRVLNALGEPCGLSEVGEVFVESHALSRGYLNDPELTAKVMTELPDGRRRYRTGDIGCRLPDGTILLLGRKDNQVKIRGFRIELSEVEAHARAHAAVAEATVVPWDRQPGDTVLVAYVVPVRADADPRQLRADVLDHLRENLPAYMVPTTVVALDRLPLTPNGKLDRRALPAPVWDEAIGGSVEPRNDIEREIASIWADVLGIERVGVEDDFFLLGGHSMLMVLLLIKIQERIGGDVDIGRILSCTTVAEQARVLAGLEV